MTGPFLRDLEAPAVQGPCEAVEVVAVGSDAGAGADDMGAPSLGGLAGVILTSSLGG